MSDRTAAGARAWADGREGLSALFPSTEVVDSRPPRSHTGALRSYS